MASLSASLKAIERIGIWLLIEMQK
jgi:hypothetical protein